MAQSNQLLTFKSSIQCDSIHHCAITKKAYLNFSFQHSCTIVWIFICTTLSSLNINLKILYAHLVVHDLAISFHQGLRIERCLAVQHFIHADTQRPPVALGSVLAFSIFHCLQDFWGDVVWSAHCHRGLDLDGGMKHKSTADPKRSTKEISHTQEALGSACKEIRQRS